MSIHQSSHLTIPSTLTYEAGLSTSDVILGSRVNKFYPLSDSIEYKAGSQITFRLSTKKALDTDSVQLHFTLKTDEYKDGAAVAWPGAMVMNSHASSLIRSLSVKFGSFQTERLDFYNSLHSVLESTVSDSYQRTLGQVEGYSRRAGEFVDSLSINGAGDDLLLNDYKDGKGFIEAALIAKDSAEQNAGVQYSIRLDVAGLFSMDKLMLVESVGFIDIEIQLETPERAFSGWDVANTPYYQISNPYITATLLDLSPTYTSAYYNALQQSIPIEQSTYNTFTQPLTANTFQTVRIHKQFSSLQTIWLVFQADVDQQATRDQTKNFPLLGCNSYRVLVDGRPVSSHNISTAAGANSESFMEMLKSLRLNADVTHTSLLNRTSYENDKFIIGIDLEHSSTNHLSGTSVASEIAIELNFDSNPIATNAANAMCFLQYNRRLVIMPGQQFQDLS